MTTDTTPAAIEARYLIRKLGYFYGKNERGYTSSAIQAGRYTLADAQKITHPNGLKGPRDGMDYIHEREILDPDWQAFSALAAERDAAQAELATLRKEVADLRAAFGYAAVDLSFLRSEHAAWSQAQFGDVSPVGPAKHLSTEALEVAADPTDAIEHADCWMLLWDMQRRAGISDEQLADAVRRKLMINKSRKWPEPKEGEAREHAREPLTAEPLGLQAASADREASQ